MRALVTGAGGLLGAAIIHEFSHVFDLQPLDRAALDVSEDAAVSAVVRDSRPDVIINCAAYNDVDGAELDAMSALRVNAFGVLALARAARDAGAVLVHYSTDFVFDGDASRPYTEDDAPNPRGVYAASKLLGDWFALEHPRAYVLRVESLFGNPGREAARLGSLGTMVSRIRAGQEVPVFVDRTVSPSYTPDVARATRTLLETGAAPGLYHCVNTGAAAWDEIASEAARLLGLPLRRKPITIESAGRKARQPRYCALSNVKLVSTGVTMARWQDALGQWLGAFQRP